MSNIQNLKPPATNNQKKNTPANNTNAKLKQLENNLRNFKPNNTASQQQSLPSMNASKPANSMPPLTTLQSQERPLNQNKSQLNQPQSSQQQMQMPQNTKLTNQQMPTLLNANNKNNLVNSIDNLSQNDLSNMSKNKLNNMLKKLNEEEALLTKELSKPVSEIKPNTVKNSVNQSEKQSNQLTVDRRENRSNIKQEIDNSEEPKWVFILKIIIVVIVIIALIYLARYLITKYIDTTYSSPYLLKNTKNGKFPLAISQDPSSVNNIPIKRSDGKNGIEFTYSFWFLIDNFDYKKGEWKHMFHKGNDSSYPNRAPGVWIHPNTNSLRVYMNTQDNILEYVDIENIPVRKWVYMDIILKNKNLDIYVNGYLKIRKELSSIPKQNDDDFWISMFGGFEGYISNIRYYPYVIDYSEIYSNINSGPSANNCIDTGEVPPYMDENWWFTFNGH
jgi:hypothetical protein